MTRRQILLALLPPLFFGTGFTIAKPAVAHFPPLFMMLMVYGGIAIAMLLTPGHPLRTPWRLGSARKLGRSMIVSSGAKSFSA